MPQWSEVSGANDAEGMFITPSGSGWAGVAGRGGYYHWSRSSKFCQEQGPGPMAFSDPLLPDPVIQTHWTRGEDCPSSQQLRVADLHRAAGPAHSH